MILTENVASQAFAEHIIALSSHRDGKEIWTAGRIGLAKSATSSVRLDVLTAHRIGGCAKLI